MTHPINYWALKTLELLSLCKEREIYIPEEENTNRKLMIEQLRIFDVKQGTTDEVVMIDSSEGYTKEDSESGLVAFRPLEEKIRQRGRPAGSKNKRANVEDTQQPIATPPKEPAVSWVLVQFHYRSENENPYVFVGVNGKCFYIPKDVPVKIPKYLLGPIDDAIETKTTRVRTQEGQWDTRQMKVHRFPYTVLRTYKE